jgi:hypothetical protein
MLGIYFLQHWFNLSDPAVEEALNDSLAMRRFVGITIAPSLTPVQTPSLAPVLTSPTRRCSARRPSPDGYDASMHHQT